MDHSEEAHLRAVSALQKNVEKQRDRFWYRAPFVWAVLVFLLTATAGGATWTTVLWFTVSADHKWIEAHQNDSNEVKRNTENDGRRDSQVRELYKKVFGFDPM